MREVQFVIPDGDAGLVPAEPIRDPCTPVLMIDRKRRESWVPALALTRSAGMTTETQQLNNTDRRKDLQCP